MKTPLILLHGALSNASQLTPLQQALADKFEVHNLDFPGHQKNAPYKGAIDVQTLTAFVLDYIEQYQLEAPHLFGYSLGGYLALNLARLHPQKVGRVYTQATDFFWTSEFAQKNIAHLNADKMLEKVPAFAQALRQTFGDDYWRVVLDKTKDMMQRLGDNDLLPEGALRNITNPVVVALGEQDKLVNKAASQAVANSLRPALASYRQELTNGGHDSKNFQTTMGLHINVAKTNALARQQSQQYLTRYCVTRAVGNSKTFDELMEKQLICIGDPDHVTQQLKTMAYMGTTRVLALKDFGGMPFELVKSSLGLLANEVYPALKNV
jgi:pimeloyl-ACP methyl ester carboxylesterase